MMEFPFSEFTYNGTIFDAHAHVIDVPALDLFVKIGNKYGVSGAALIVHGNDIAKYKSRYPNRFLYAKYFSGWTLFTEDPTKAIEDVRTLRKEGYDLAKMHFAPFWSDRLSDVEKIPSADDNIFDPLFDALHDEQIPVIIHVGDPDTYFETRYSDAGTYGTKEDHLQEFEYRLKKKNGPIIQAAHFCAQPEEHRIDNLARMLNTYPKLNIDTSSARWMARELGKYPEKARNFFEKYADRILFGTDCVARTMDPDYYEGRHSTQRLMWETSVEKVPLPFVDNDTIHTGGTFIFGLDLSEKTLSKIYWENAQKMHNLPNL